MAKYLIDNNVISHYFSAAFGEKAMRLIADVLDDTPKISVITKIEALSWLNSDVNKESIIRQFINDSQIFQLTEDIVEECIKLRRSRKIKTPDAIIAATAIVHDFILISSDRGFIQIPKLKVINPNDT